MTINIPSGLEARPVALFVQVASRYESSIFVEVEDKRINAKSIMGIFSLDLSKPITLNIHADDSAAIVEAIKPFIV